VYVINITCDQTADRHPQWYVQPPVSRASKAEAIQYLPTKLIPCRGPNFHMPGRLAELKQDSDTNNWEFGAEKVAKKNDLIQFLLTGLLQKNKD